MAVGEELAREADSSGMSLIVTDANIGARRLYERLGYAERASRPMIKDDWKNPANNWILLVKPF